MGTQLDTRLGFTVISDKNCCQNFKGDKISLSKVDIDFSNVSTMVHDIKATEMLLSFGNVCMIFTD